MYYDPVCKKTLTGEQVKATVTYNERTFEFCCNECREKFNLDPETYIGKNWWQRLLYKLAESNAQEFKGSKPTCH